ncbi:putative RNA-directed DNA polymerase, eukaryota, reverse transcriptase zinc-binding domain protein [Tanacetum coccineum]
MREFNDGVANIEVEDVNSTGLHFTWNQKPREERGILKKTDRVMSNIDFNNSFPGSYAIFQPYRISDHAHAVLKVHRVTKDKPKPFKLVVRLRHQLNEVQRVLDRNPSSNTLHDEEAVYFSAFTTVSLDEERFLKQKSKIEWLQVGDTNSAYFYCSVKARTIRSRIDCLDGYTSVFFKKAWEAVGSDVCNAVQDFFLNGKLLKEVKHTIIALLPKVSTPSRVNDYRLSSCCNVIYKCISKIITNRIKDGLDDIVSENQLAFVPGWSILDNILLTQELMHTYHLNKGQPCCAIKIDIQKAYDTVSWEFLEDILTGFCFHTCMVKWIMACISSTSFSININVELHGYFKSKHGLRQGDPISLYVFTLVMEILTLLLKRKASDEDEFTYHYICSKQKIINVCLALVTDIHEKAKMKPKATRPSTGM